MVIWIIGLSASGKTTLGVEMIRLLKQDGQTWALLDGDTVRALYGDQLGHTVDARRENGERIINLCRFFDQQNINVIACVLSIFPEHQQQNRTRFSHYREIWMEASMQTLMRRDRQNLYQRAQAGQIRNVVGVDLPFTRPQNPDLIIDNNPEQLDFTQMAYAAIDALGIPLQERYPYCARDGLAQPQTYQYTPFEGERFLTRYQRARTDALAMLSGQIERLAQAEKWPVEQRMGELAYALERFTQEYPQTLQDYRQDAQIVTSRFLTALLRDTQPRLGDVLPLIRRFEVTKRLYTRYQPDTFKRAGQHYRAIENYLLFANILVRLYPTALSHDAYLILNALLKVNDLILSRLQDVVSAGEKLLAYCALHRELAFYQALKEDALC